MIAADAAFLLAYSHKDLQTGAFFQTAEAYPYAVLVVGTQTLLSLVLFTPTIEPITILPHLKVFADAESGLVSRVTPVVLPDMVGAKMPEFKMWTKEEEEKVKRQCLCLMDEEGEVDLPLINKAIEEWDEGKRQEYLQTLRYSLDVLRRRAALNGFRAGIIAYLLEGRQETERAIKFALWYAERCLHYQLQLYGDKIDALHNNTLSPQTSKSNIHYLDALPKEFTKEDLVNLRLSNNESPVVKTIIYRWVKEGLVVKTNTNLWQKIQ